MAKMFYCADQRRSFIPSEQCKPIIFPSNDARDQWMIKGNLKILFVEQIAFF